MLILRQFNPLLLQRFSLITRNYAKKSTKMAAANYPQKQVHQEMLRHINPYARININTEIPIKVKSSDVVEYPDADAFIAELHGSSQVKNCTAVMQISVSDDEKQVDVFLKKLAVDTDFHCQLAVPIRADLFIDSLEKVSVENMYNDVVQVCAGNNIKVKDVRSEKIILGSMKGNINCVGTLTGKETIIKTEQQGNVSLDKLLGDNLFCKTESGNISTNSCYVESSKFETNNGCLQLKNVHKKMEIYVHDRSNLNMSGVHGNLKLFARRGNINLQLSEISGESSIEMMEPDEAIINISNEIEQNCYLKVISDTEIKFEDSLKHLCKNVSKTKDSFLFTQNEDTNAPNNSLIIRNNGGNIKLGKLSWAESIGAAFQNGYIN